MAGRRPSAASSLPLAANSACVAFLSLNVANTRRYVYPAVDLLEEVVSDGEGEGSGRAGKKGGGKGKKRKPSTD